MITTEYTTIPAERIIPLHEITDPAKVERLADSMRSHGWLGEPLLVVGEVAYTGTHRRAAAERAGIECEVYLVTPPTYDPDDAESQPEWLDRLIAARDDEERLEALEAWGDDGAVTIMTAEIQVIL